ncbi:MAG: plasmid pRiA4b ORF-3 family protein, partial [Geminicoccales bacterium]
MSQPSPAHNVIVQIKVKLLGATKPPVWRQLQLPVDTRLDQLHEILQAALGWENYHMHAFSFAREEFGIPDPELGFSDERQVTLGELITGVGDRFRYTYDFGDDWEHEIVIEDLLDADPETHYPILVAAKGACPPEDCGGSWGYA